jgi:enoyl-CoA hydratase/carnithine racemase
MNDYEFVLQEQEDRVRIIRLNRPDALNAFSAGLSSDLANAMHDADEDPDVGTMVITGAGRAFSAGADIGAVNGVAVGMAVTGPLMWDITLASTEARFSFRFAALGLTPELGSTWTLPRVVGLQRAKEMMLTGRIYSAEDALEIGLVHRLYEPDDLIPEAVKLGNEIAANPEGTLREIKALLWNDLMDSGSDETWKRSSEHFAASRKTAEHRESLLAFREKRSPKFHDNVHMEGVRQGIDSAES